MNEIEYKINCNDPVIVTRTISMLVENIKKKSDEFVLKKNTNQMDEVRYLKEKCLSSDPVISKTAGRGLCFLIEKGVLPFQNVLLDMIAALSSTQNYTGLINMLYELLVLDVRIKLKTENQYKCSFMLHTSQHPFVTVLMHNSKAHVEVFSCLKQIYRSQEGFKSDFCRPVFLYAFCDPNMKLPQDFLKEVWRFLINTNEESSVLLVSEILFWIQILKREHLSTVSYMILQLFGGHFTANRDFLQVLILWTFALLYELILKKCDPTEVIYNLKKVVLEHGVCDLNNCILWMLSNCVSMCSSVYLNDLLELCVAVVNPEKCSKKILFCIKATLLHWTIHPCILISDNLNIINDLLIKIDSFDDRNCNTFSTSNILLSLMQSTNEHVSLALDLCELVTDSQENSLHNFIDSLDQIQLDFLKPYLLFLMGLVLSDDNEQIAKKALQILLKCCTKYNFVATNLLTVILYKLANSKDPTIHLALLKAVPRMGILKENLQLVVSTLEALRKGPEKLRVFSTHLFYDLWEIQVRCYPLLQKLLMENLPKNVDRLEFYCTKAKIVKELCRKRPELYGTELAGFVSKILNQCKDEDVALASKLALDGLRYLCLGGIVDVGSAWVMLSPRFNTDNRTIVIESLCELIAEIPNLTSPVQRNYQLEEQVIGKLWSYTDSSDLDVVKAAYKSLKAFNLEQISEHLPRVYVDANVKNLADLQLFNYVPGTSWILLLENGNRKAINSAGDLLIDLVSKEVAGYRKDTYEVSGRQGEPVNYNFLPVRSIVRALGNYIKKHVSEMTNGVDEEVYLQCLRILSQEYVKPLPPFDWCFLQELVHVPSVRRYCITLASHQVVLSGTARRFVENFIVAHSSLEVSIADIELIYENLKHLCNSIQPSVLKPFLVTSLTVALKQTENENPVSFKNLCVILKDILVDKNISDVNKTTVSQVVVNLINKSTGTNNSFFDELLVCLSALPEKYLIELTSSKTWSFISEEKLLLATKINTEIALNSTESPLCALNDVLETASSIRSSYSFVFEQTMKVFNKHCGHRDNLQWILELLGRIQVNLLEGKYNIEQAIFLCDVFMLAVVIFSGRSVFFCKTESLMNETKALFPQSVCVLAKRQTSNCMGQILEWLLYMTNDKTIPLDYRLIFYKTMGALKHTEAFSELLRWMKYVECCKPC